MKRKQTAEQAAEILGVYPDTLRRYTRDKDNPAPHTKTSTGRIMVDAGELASWARDNGIEWGRIGRPPQTDESPDLEAARLRKENALASKYELQVARERATLVPVDDVKREWGTRVTAARNRFLGLPASVVPRLEGRNAAEMQAMLEKDIREILDELAGGTGASVAGLVAPSAEVPSEPMGGGASVSAGGSGGGTGSVA